MNVAKISCDLLNFIENKNIYTDTDNAATQENVR